MKVTYKVDSKSCEITLDGKRIEAAVVGFQLVSPAGQRPQVTIVLLPDEITIEAANPQLVLETADVPPAPEAPTPAPPEAPPAPNRAARRSHKKKVK